MTTIDDFTIPLSNNADMGVPHLSPTGQAHLTLSSPYIGADEGFSEGLSYDRPTSDFTLYDPNPSNNMNNNANFFPDINQFGGQFDNDHENHPQPPARVSNTSRDNPFVGVGPLDPWDTRDMRDALPNVSAPGHVRQPSDATHDLSLTAVCSPKSDEGSKHV